MDKELKISEVNGNVLAKVLEYCTRRAELGSEDELQAFDRYIAEGVHNMLFDLLKVSKVSLQVGSLIEASPAVNL